MKASSNTRHRGLICLALLACSGLLSVRVQAQNAAPTPPPRPTPVTFKPEEDPNAPGLSRAERIRRQEIYIRNKMAQNSQAQLEAQKKAADEETKTKGETPADARPNTPPPAQPGQTVAPGQTPTDSSTDKNADKNKHVVYKIVVKEKDVLGEDPWGFKKIAFYNHPASVVVEEGRVFQTICKLVNLDREAPDRVDLVVRYPKEFVTPLSIHEDTIKDMLAGPAHWGIDKDRGELHYAARFSQPLDAIDTPLIEIVWRALAPAEGISIEMDSAGRSSQAWMGEKMITGNEFGPGGTVTGTSLRIVAPKPAVPAGERLIVDASLDEYRPALAALGSLDDYPPVLWLDYERREQYEPGQWIVADVVLSNANNAPFDELRFALSFDPAALEIADSDERNWIRTGDNILDGPFREVWRWDSLGADRVDSDAGVIEYRMGRADFRRQPSGVVARIFARVKRPVAEPLFDWIVNPESEEGGQSRPTTGVYLMGVNLIERHAQMNAPEEMILLGPRADSGGIAEKADPTVYREPRRRP